MANDEFFDADMTRAERVELHGAQLRIATDALVHGIDAQVAREHWAIKYGERLITDLMEVSKT